ncbi:hypothetical protein DSECCO2_577770 [anaerobic digester metagenome]
MTGSWFPRPVSNNFIVSSYYGILFEMTQSIPSPPPCLYEAVPHVPFDYVTSTVTLY